MLGGYASRATKWRGAFCGGVFVGAEHGRQGKTSLHESEISIFRGVSAASSRGRLVRCSRYGADRASQVDLSVTGVRLRFSPHQAAGVLKESDVEWQDVRLKFKDVEEDLVLSGHFLMVYDREGGLFTTGLEFTDVTMEQQFKLVMLYARYRKDAER